MPALHLGRTGIHTNTDTAIEFVMQQGRSEHGCAPWRPAQTAAVLRSAVTAQPRPEPRPAATAATRHGRRPPRAAAAAARRRLQAHCEGRRGQTLAERGHMPHSRMRYPTGGLRSLMHKTVAANSTDVAVEADGQRCTRHSVAALNTAAEGVARFLCRLLRWLRCTGRLQLLLLLRWFLFSVRFLLEISFRRHQGPQALHVDQFASGSINCTQAADNLRSNLSLR